MKINIQICALLLLFNLVTSCNGQVKTDAQKSEQKTNVGGQPKIIRTQGIVSGNIYCNLQDKAGNIWFGTRGFGLSRYDGKSFVSFSEQEQYETNSKERMQNFHCAWSPLLQSIISRSAQSLFLYNKSAVGY